MNKIRISILLITIFLFFFLFFLVVFSKPLSLEKIGEEAIPIREDGIIIGMDYYITINKYMKDNSITISSHVLDSILHYKDPSLIHNFFIRLSIDNKSKYDYLLKNICILDNYSNIVIKKLSYKKDGKYSFIVFLPDTVFKSSDILYKIQIELEK